MFKKEKFNPKSISPLYFIKILYYIVDKEFLKIFFNC